MEKKEVLTISKSYFKSLGFQTLKKNKYYFESDDLILRVWVDHSDFGEYFYIDYSIRLKALHIGEVFDDYDWDIGGRLIFNRNKCFEVEYSSLNQDDYLKTLKELSEKQIVPIMQNGISFIKKLINNSTSLGSYIFFKKDDKNKILSL